MTTRTETGLEPGRTWRDLPPSPPVGVPLEPVTITTDVSEPPPPPPRRRWPWVTGAGVLVAAGIVVGLLLPGWLEGSSDTFAASSPPSERIVPPDPPEFSDPGTTLPSPNEPSVPPEFQDLIPPGFLEGLPPDFFDRFFNGRSPGDQFSFNLDGIIRITETPEGYSATGNSMSVGPGGIRQQLTLTDGSEQITITATRGLPGELPAGDDVTVRGVVGRLDRSGDRLQLGWQESDLMTVVIDAPESLGEDAMLSLAESLEVTP